MNLGYAALLLLHILLLVYWLGADLGVFYSAGFLTNSALSVETRRTVMKILHFIDLFPRIALVTMLPVGISLALISGYASVPRGWIVPVIALAWVAAAAWLVLVVKNYGSPQPGLTRLDYWIRYLVVAGLLSVAGASFAGIGPIAPGNLWLELKLVIFAGIIVCGLGIRATFKPFAAAFGQLVREGSSPAVEAAMKQAQSRVRPVVLTLWGALVIEAFLGLSKI
jgi:hypothetical protein